MAELLVTHRLGALRPIDEAGQEILRGIKQGELVKIELRRPRNVRFHRLFFGLLSLVHQNTEGFGTVEELLAVVKIGIGHVDLISFKGQVVKIPKSISFARMDADAFRAFWDRAVDYIIIDLEQAHD